MGKASKLKKIRKMASRLPAINYKTVKGSLVKGYELQAKGVNEVQGKQIDVNATYRHKEIFLQPINHNRHMKNIFKKHGMIAIDKYIHAVKNYSAHKNAV